METGGSWIAWPPRSAWARAALLLALAFALRAWDFGDPVLHVDEEWYLLVGDRMLRGALPYVDLWDRKPVGLFALYAGMRLLPGEGIIAYQVVATLFAAGTAWLIERCAQEAGARPRAALAAGAGYLLWLPLLSGRGGQSPVFYDLFMAGGALLTLRLPALAETRATGAIVRSGALACLLAGLAIAVKYTPALEGAFFGLAHLWYLRRAGAGSGGMATGALLWMALGALPSAVPIFIYWRLGPQTFQAFWFANFVSITLRGSYPVARIIGRLSGSWAQLSPLVIAAVLTWRARPRSAAVRLALLWLAAALAGWVSVGTFFDHYSLPLLAPLLTLAAVAWSTRGRLMALSLTAALLTGCVKGALGPHDAAGARELAAFVKLHSGRECPYVFTGDSITYYLAAACTPTRFAFPSTLSQATERGSTGIDEAAEIRRIMRARPPVVVVLDPPAGPQPSEELRADLARDYRPALRVPAHDGIETAYLRTVAGRP